MSLMHGQYNDTNVAVAVTSGGDVYVSPASSASWAVDIAKANGATINIGAGNAGTGTIRVSISTDDVNLSALKTAAEIMDDWDESDRAKVNIISGQAGVAAGSGASGATVVRVILATDDPAVTSLAVMDDWDESDRCKVNLIVGQAGVAAGAGAVGVTVPRVTLASDDPAVTALQLIDNTIGTDGSASGTALVRIGGTDGTNDQTAKMDSSGQQYVIIDGIAGEDDINGWTKVLVNGQEGYTPSGTTGTAVNDTGGGDIGDVILASTEVIKYNCVCLEVRNAGGGSGHDLDRIIVRASVSGSNWGTIHDSGTGAAWASGDGAYLVLIERNAYRYLKVEALCSAGQDTTADCYLAGN